MASQPDAGAVAGGQPGDRLAAPADAPDVNADPMWYHAYRDVQAVLDKALGPEEEDGAGAGIAADVALLAAQRDAARTEAGQLAARLRELTDPGLFAVVPVSADPETPLSDEQNAIGNVIRKVESWAMDGDLLDPAEVQRVLLGVFLRQWMGGIRLPGARSVSEPEAIGTGPLLDPDCKAGKCAPASAPRASTTATRSRRLAVAETFERLLAIVREVDAHLDANTAEAYRKQPLAGHWARITKVCEEAGEVWKALSRLTGENPRKGRCGTEEELLEELGDTASAAWCAIQHITKDEARTAWVIVAALEKAHRRVGEFAGEASHG
jgi:NTP pyrophosphatase (non-canonical NTP hydrolase)